MQFCSLEIALSFLHRTIPEKAAVDLLELGYVDGGSLCHSKSSAYPGLDSGAGPGPGGCSQVRHLRATGALAHSSHSSRCSSGGCTVFSDPQATAVPALRPWGGFSSFAFRHKTWDSSDFPDKAKRAVCAAGGTHFLPFPGKGPFPRVALPGHPQLLRLPLHTLRPQWPQPRPNPGKPLRAARMRTQHAARPMAPLGGGAHARARSAPSPALP